MRIAVICLTVTVLVAWSAPLLANDTSTMVPEELLGASRREVQVLPDTWQGYPGGFLDLDLTRQTADPLRDARSWVDRYTPEFGVQDPQRELVLGRVSRSTNRQFIWFDQTVGGIPVLGGAVVVVLDQDGQLRSLINGYIPLQEPLGEQLVEPTWDREQAYAQAMAEGDGLFVSPDRIRAEEVTRLVFVSPLGQSPQLAWEVHPPGAAAFWNYRLYYDAFTGERLHVYNDIRHENLANVYLFSPGYEGTADTVVGELSLRDDPDGYLTGPYIKVNNCIDLGETITRRTREVPICSEVQVAQADESGDFLYEPDFLAPDDLFAEAHMYYHTMQIYQYHQSLGLDSVQAVPLLAVVNYRIAGSLVGSEEPLVPYDNAFFYPAGESVGPSARETDSIVFGQGTLVDFAYDADVIYHEFTHAVFQKIASPGWFTYDETGLRADPGALNEAMADYFAGTLTGDPEIGEYVGPRVDFVEGSARNIRTMDNTDSCPTSLLGEVHQDSVHFTGALWEIRTAYLQARPEEIVAFDTAVYNAMNQFTALVTFDRAAALLHNEWEDLEVDLTEAAETAWANHGVVDCERVVDLDGPGASEDIMFLYGPDTFALTPWVPGFIQYRVTIPESDLVATSISLSFDLQTSGGGRWGGPLTVGFAVSHGEPVQIELAGSRLSGSWTDEISAYQLRDTRHVALYEVSDGLEPGEYYFLPIGMTGIEGILLDLGAEVEYKEPEEEEEPEPVVEPALEEPEELAEELVVDAGMEDQGGDEQGAETSGSGSDEDGCGCTAGGPARGTGLFWLVLVSGFGIYRVRRRLILS